MLCGKTSRVGGSPTTHYVPRASIVSHGWVPGLSSTAFEYRSVCLRAMQSLRVDSNHRPLPYEGIALPLCYGAKKTVRSFMTYHGSRLYCLTHFRGRPIRRWRQSEKHGHSILNRNRTCDLYLRRVAFCPLNYQDLFPGTVVPHSPEDEEKTECVCDRHGMQ